MNDQHHHFSNHHPQRHTYQSGQNPNAQPFDPNAFYYQRSDETPTATTLPAWYEVSCVRAGASDLETSDSICALAFDPRKELIWAATASGMLHTHLATDMSRIVSSYISEPVATTTDLSVSDVVVSPDVVLAAVHYGLAIVSRGGVPRASVRADAVKNAKALALNPLTDGRHVCIGGDSRMLSVIDVESARIVRQATLRGATGVTGACWAAGSAPALDSDGSTPTPESVANLAIFSTATGRISLCDPSTMREVNAIAAFTGATTSVATSGNHIVATGMASRGGVSYLEQTVKLYDIRAIETPLPSVLFPAPPTRVTFDACAAAAYGVNMAMWAVAPSGLLQLFDLSSTPATPLSEQIQLDAGSDMLTSMAVSSQGLVVLGDSGGFVHQWACTDPVKVNADSEPIWPTPLQAEPPVPSIQLDELLTADCGTSIPKCAIPDYDNGFLTDEMFEPPADVSKSRGAQNLHASRIVVDPDSYKDFYIHDPFARFPLAVSDDIVNRAQRGQSTVAFTQAPPSFRRNSESGHKDPPTVPGLNTSSYSAGRRGRPDRHTSGSKSIGSAGKRGGKLDLSKPIGRCAYVEMDLVAWESIEGFDFLRYNQSGVFCGLENSLPNVYVNSVVQMLYFTPPIRRAIAEHTCDRDWCISCELGFLFHMFDLGGAGMACEAGNFTRAFMTMANTGALGLLDGPHALPLSERIENFSRYLLEQLHKDDEMRRQRSSESTKSAVAAMFGGDTVSYGVFTTSNTEWERWSCPFQFSLTYEEQAHSQAKFKKGGNSEGPSGPRASDSEIFDLKGESFCALLQRCLWQSLEPTRAFCEAKQQFETMTHRRELRSLPNVLCLGCNTKAKGYAEFWLGNNGLPTVGSINTDVNEIARKAISRDKKLVESINIDLTDGIKVTEIDSTDKTRYGYDEDDEGDAKVEATGDQMADYDLSFVIAHVKSSGTNDYSEGSTIGGGVEDSVKYGRRNVGGHLVAYIKVTNGYRKRKQTPANTNDSASGPTDEGGGDDSEGISSEWWCFNDFVISKVEGLDEVAAFDKEWKMPCLIGYVRRDVRKRAHDVPQWWMRTDTEKAQASVRDVIGCANQNAAIGIQHDEEPPGRGSVLGLDCEFVMVSREEAEIYGDGRREVVVPARNALARVSVVRGYGRLHGEALIDDYVAVREPVVDYLTRFSGLVEGDLHVGRSRYTLSSLKSVYKRLRCLVDAGCVFVGHGLKSDFRIINFVVPPQQVIDTVTIFRLPHKRLLGLRFLTHALLGDDIQRDTHDSIEDSNAALTLYVLYASLKSVGENRFSSTLKDLYAYGYRHGWKVDPQQPFEVSWSVDTNTRGAST